MISFNFRLIYGLRVLQEGLNIGQSDCIQMSETSELPGAPPPGPPPGALRRAPGPHADLRSAHFAHYALTFFSTPTSKNVPRALYTYSDTVSSNYFCFINYIWIQRGPAQNCKNNSFILVINFFGGQVLRTLSTRDFPASNPLKTC